MEIKSILWLVFMLAATIGLLAFVIYTIRQKVFQPQQWGAALAAGITWGLAGLVGAFIFSDAWLTFIEKLAEGYSLHDTIRWEVYLPGYYSMSLAGILAGVIGCAVLYRLLQR